MSNGTAYPIGSSLNQGQLGSMVGVGIPIESVGFPESEGPVFLDTSTLPSDYAVNQAFGTQTVASPYTGNLTNALTQNAVIDNSAGSTAAYDPLTGGDTVGGVPVIQSPGLLQINPSANPTGGVGAGGIGTTASAAGGAGGSGSTVNVGLQPTLASFIGGIGSYLNNWVVRGFLIIIGLVIAAIGIMHLMGHDVVSFGRK